MDGIQLVYLVVQLRLPFKGAIQFRVHKIGEVYGQASNGASDLPRKIVTWSSMSTLDNYCLL
jgi:hypothetical protein